MKKIRWIVVALAILLGVVPVGCWLYGKYVEDQEFKQAALVFSYVPKSPGGMIMVGFGSYRGGLAVLGGHPPETQTAFWVKDGRVYTVNEAARAAAPTLPQAPEEIVCDDAFIAAAE